MLPVRRKDLRVTVEHLPEQERFVRITDELNVVALQHAVVRHPRAVHPVLTHHVRVLLANEVHDFVEPPANGDPTITGRVRMVRRVAERDHVEISVSKPRCLGPISSGSENVGLVDVGGVVFLPRCE